MRDRNGWDDQKEHTLYARNSSPQYVSVQPNMSQLLTDTDEHSAPQWKQSPPTAIRTQEPLLHLL